VSSRGGSPARISLGSRRLGGDICTRNTGGFREVFFNWANTKTTSSLGDPEVPAYSELSCVYLFSVFVASAGTAGDGVSNWSFEQKRVIETQRSKTL